MASLNFSNNYEVPFIQPCITIMITICFYYLANQIDNIHLDVIILILEFWQGLSKLKDTQREMQLSKKKKKKGLASCQWKASFAFAPRLLIPSHYHPNKITLSALTWGSVICTVCIFIYIQFFMLLSLFLIIVTYMRT